MRIRDLTDPAAGPHAMQLIVNASSPLRLRDVPVRAVPRRPGGVRPRPLRPAALPADAVTRDRRYSRYVGDDQMLRAHTTAHIPALLREAARPRRAARGPRDLLPPRRHRPAPRRRTPPTGPLAVRPAGPPLGERRPGRHDRPVVGAVLPGRPVTTPPSPHPYTVDGREIYVDGVEIGECGAGPPGGARRRRSTARRPASRWASGWTASPCWSRAWTTSGCCGRRIPGSPPR